MITTTFPPLSFLDWRVFILSTFPLTSGMSTYCLIPSFLSLSLVGLADASNETLREAFFFFYMTSYIMSAIVPLHTIPRGVQVISLGSFVEHRWGII